MPGRVRQDEQRLPALVGAVVEHRGTEVVCLVSSDIAVRGTSGQEVQKRSSATFLGDMEAVWHSEERPHHLRETLDPETRAREGVFMAFQYPVEIPGVNNAYFLKAALNAVLFPQSSFSAISVPPL